MACKRGIDNLKTNSLKCELYTRLLFQEFDVLCREHILIQNAETIQLNKNRKTVFNFLLQFRNLCGIGKCSLKRWQLHVLSLPYKLPLDIVWILDSVKILELSYYIRARQSSHFLEDLITEFIRLSTVEHSVTKTICDSLLFSVFNSELSHGREEIMMILCEKVVEQLEKTEENNYLIILKSLERCLKLENFANFLKRLIKALCISKGSVDIPGKIDTKEALRLQRHSFVDNKHLSDLFDFFWKHLNMCEALTFVEEIGIFMKEDILNWKYMFALISTYGLYYTDGFANIKKIVSSLIDKSFIYFNSVLVSNAFLIARQCCFLSSSSFSNYAAWFSSSFSAESSRPINNIDICTFFFSFLSELVQSDSPYYLKVHINKVPCVPSHCQALLSDYVTLAKTRLTDLNHTWDLGLFNHDCDSKNTPQTDVDGVLSHFEKTGEIVNSLLEASIFCKSYFEKRFLLELLCKFEGLSSSRHQVIEKLYKMGKILPSMYLKYKQLI